jgi:hypothetical protein
MRVEALVVYRCMENQPALTVLSCNADVRVVVLEEGLQVDCSLKVLCSYVVIIRSSKWRRRWGCKHLSKRRLNEFSI